MNLHQLRCAVTVARLGSQTRAAEALYMSQPNLSKALKELEETCGFRIFTRTGAGMIPTRKGEEFILRARSVLEQMDAMDAVYQGHNRQTAYLSVAIPRASYIAHALTEYVNALEPREGIELNIRETNTAEVVSDVLSREVDIGVVRFSVENQNKFLGELDERQLHYILYWTFRYAVIVSKQHPLAKEKCIRSAQLKPYVEISHGDTAQPITQDEPAPDGSLEQRRIRVYERGSQFDLLHCCPFTYMWVSPMPQEELKRQGLVQLICEDVTAEHQDALIYLKGYTLNRWEQAFYDQIVRQVEAVRLY